MDYAPICVFTFKRYDHTVRTLEALSANIYAKQSDLFIFCDNWKKEIDRASVEQVRGFVKEFKERNLFKSTTVVFADMNKGLAKSIISGVTEVIEKYGKVIVFEDDLLTTRGCLEYFNACLDYYKDNVNIWSISGYSFPMTSLSNYPQDIYLSYRGSSWGWATWKDRWETVDWEVSDYNSFKINPFLRKKFARGGNDMPAMLDRQMNHFIDSWAIRWCYSQWKQEKYTIFPKESRIYNMGLDGTGTHGGKTTKFNTQLAKDESIHLENVVINKKICDEFKKKYDVPLFKCCLSYIKNNILHTKYLNPNRYRKK